MEQETLNATLHEVIERTRVKAMHSLTGVLANVRMSESVCSLSHWHAQQFQLRVHILGLEHACRTLLSMACDLAVAKCLFQVDRRSEKFAVEKARIEKYLQSIRDTYLLSSGPPTPAAGAAAEVALLRRETVLHGVANAVLGYSIRGVAHDRFDQVAKIVIDRTRYMPKIAAPTVMGDLLTSANADVSAKNCDADQAIDWLMNEQQIVIDDKKPTETYHTRLHTHP